jgi:DNA-directed RNA polymerase subunit RPC12/RpoP
LARKPAKKKKETKPLCASCSSDQVDVITFDTLSVDARPIQEDEIRCRACGHKAPKE